MYNKNTYDNLYSILRNNKIDDLHSVFDVFYSVLKTKKCMSDANADKIKIHETMLFNTIKSDKQYINDAEIFFELYSTINTLDDKEILDCVSILRKKHELILPFSLEEKFFSNIYDTASSILITECEKYGSFLLTIAKNFPDKELSFTTTNEDIKNFLMLIFEEYNNINIYLTDIYSRNFTSQKFDLIYSFPIFGGRAVEQSEDFISHDLDMMALENLLSHLNDNGQLTILLPAKITFGGGKIAKLREYIINNYKVLEISELPIGIFYPYSGVRSYMLRFSTGTTENVEFNKYDGVLAGKKRNEFSDLCLIEQKSLSNSDFFSLSSWSTDMVFYKDAELELFKSSSTKKVKLKEVALVFRGKSITSNSNSGDIGVVNISNITETEVDCGTIVRIEEDKLKVKRYELEDGDLLLTTRGTAIKTGVFKKQDILCIASANLCVIRPSKDISTEYLKIFFNSTIGAKMLKSLQRGASVMNINYKDVEELEVPIPSIERQNEIIHEYKKEFELYQTRLKEVQENWADFWNDFQKELY